MGSISGIADSGVRAYTVNLLPYQICLFFGFLILIYAVVNPDVLSSGSILYAVGSVLIFVIYPAINIFKLSGKKIILGDSYIAWNDRDRGDSRVNFADVTRIVYTSDQIGAESVSLHCFENSTSVNIPFQNFSEHDENMVRGAILSKCPSDVVVAHLKLYKSIASTVSYSFTGSEFMEPALRESIQERLKSVTNAPFAEGLVALKQIEGEILLSRTSERSEESLTPKKSHYLE